jgi:uncharacterized membrane protein
MSTSSFPFQPFLHPVTGQPPGRGVQVLLLLTVACLSMTVLRGVLTHNWWFFIMLSWNLFLAWFPLGVVLVLRDLTQTQPLPNWLMAVFLGIWLVFVPNAPYVITDLFHIRNLGERLLGYDTLMLFLAAITGLGCGLYSLLLVHRLLRPRLGSRLTWTLLLAVQPLIGFGLYLGRYVRLNSWNLVNHPLRLTASVWGALHEPMALEMTVSYGFGLGVLYVAFRHYVDD